MGDPGRHGGGAAFGGSNGVCHVPGTVATAGEGAVRLALRSALGSESQGKQDRRERQEYHADLDCNSSHITFLI
jgi:hypothetical protein